MANRVYVIPLSNPAATGRAMVAYKRIPHRVVRLPIGFHPLLLRLAGFDGITVPALELDGRKVQGTLAISRALEEARPDPPLFPAEPELRSRVEEAERWGENVLQHGPRRVFRYALMRDRELRRWVSEEVVGVAAPGALADSTLPLIRKLAALADADEPHVREALRRQPEFLDRVDELIAEGTIGGEAPNAADFQILATIRVMLEWPTSARLVQGRPCEAAARRVFPSWDGGPMPATDTLDHLE